MNRIIKNDKVKVIRGKYRGKESVVLRVFPKKYTAIVEGVNLVKIHKKHDDPKKRVVEKEQPINLSNLALLDLKAKGQSKTVKVSFLWKDEVKIRVNRKTKEKI